MTGFQVKVRDNKGNVHDERWTCDKSLAERIAKELPLTDWRVAEAWVAPSGGEATEGPTS